MGDLPCLLVCLLRTGTRCRELTFSNMFCTSCLWAFLGPLCDTSTCMEFLSSLCTRGVSFEYSAFLDFEDACMLAREKASVSTLKSLLLASNLWSAELSLSYVLKRVSFPDALANEPLSNSMEILRGSTCIQFFTFFYLFFYYFCIDSRKMAPPCMSRDCFTAASMSEFNLKGALSCSADWLLRSYISCASSYV